jgi:hypothetical protein
MERMRSAAWRARGGVVTAVLLQLVGCGGATPPASHTPDGVLRESRRSDHGGVEPFTDLRVSPDATLIKGECSATFEQCNALDDDCNGVIDDECGYESGDVQITLGWNTGADLDLYVTDPSGATLFYNERHKRSRIGGHLDHDARGDCRREQQNSRIENVYWPSPARSGSYKVEIQYFSPCAKAGTTEATLSVVVDGQLLGAYRFRLEPEQRVEALSFVKR